MKLQNRIALIIFGFGSLVLAGVTLFFFTGNHPPYTDTFLFLMTLLTGFSSVFLGRWLASALNSADEAGKGFNRIAGPDQLEAILGAIDDSLMLLSPDREVLWSNKSGYKQGDRKCYQLWHDSSSPCRGCPPLLTLENARPEESSISTDDGRVWSVRSFPVFGKNGEVSKIVELASDVTDKVRLSGEMMRTGQLASVGELAAGVAHEINNPINGIINLAQLLADENPSDDKDREIYDWIISEGNRIAVIVNELLTFSRKGDREKKPFNVGQLISKCLALTKAQMEKEGIAIKVEIPTELPEIVANPGQIQQVALNIINNARYTLNEKFPGWHKEKILEISAEKVNINNTSLLRIIFYDRGMGIPDEHKGKITNPFFSTKPEEEGTGLGLSISQGIISEHEGRLIFDSIEGEYTRVTVELPLN